MWAEAAKSLGKFDDAVLTMMSDIDGYPVSIRVDTGSYDSTTGELAAVISDSLRPTVGPANLLCHYHDEKMWSLKFVHVVGRVERRGQCWVFTSTKFAPPPAGGLLGFVRSLSTSATKYLGKRGLERPSIDWRTIKDIQRQAKS